VPSPERTTPATLIQQALAKKEKITGLLTFEH
jgi:hypothetical protein